MRKTESLAGVLDRCLARVQSGAATVEDCLRDYPELADQLGPLLRTALRAGDLLAPPGPTAAYRAASEVRLLNRVRAARAAERSQRDRTPDRAVRRRSLVWPRAWRPAYALAGLALAVALIGSSIGVASAAAGSLPGDGLYGVKRGLEEVSLALSTTRAGDTALLLDFAERRLVEAQALIETGRHGDLPAALAGYERELDRLLAQTDRDEEWLSRLEAAIERHERVLSRVLERAAPQARQAVEQALERSARGHEQVKQQRQNQPPQNVPPGQLKRTPSAEETGQPPGQDPDRTPGPPPRVTRGPKDKDK
jgi:hypothetical protein